MRKKFGSGDKIGILRSMETYGYQVAFYVLQDHRLAVEATKAALLALGGDESFFCACGDSRREKMRAQIRKTSLTVKLENWKAHGRSAAVTV